MARRVTEVEDRRAAILDAALRVFAAKGFTKATNKDIALEAGIATGLIYYYFTSKEDLFRSLVEERSPLKTMTISPEMLTYPPQVLLPRLLTQVGEIVENEPFVSIIRLILPEMITGNAAISSIVVDIFQKMVGGLENYLLQHRVQGNIRADLNTGLLVQIVISCMMGMALRRQIIGDPSALTLSWETLIQELLRQYL
jgi:AcrR family transcriptional regulator